MAMVATARKRAKNKEPTFAEYMRDIGSMWNLKKPQEISKWAEQNIFFDPKYWATSGYWDNFRFRYLVAVIQALADPDVDMVVNILGTQMGKTAALGCYLAWIAATMPTPCLVSCPDEKSALAHQKNKLVPMFESVDCLRHKLKPEAKRSRTALDLGDQIIYYAWSGAAWTLSDRAAAIIVINECNLHSRKKSGEGDPVAMVQDRVKGFSRHKIYVEGKATVDGECRMYAAYNQTNQCRLQVPCPHCKRFQFLELGRMEDDFGLKWEQDASGDVRPDTVYYLCRHCHERIYDRHKPSMMQQCVWVPKGQEANEDGSLSGTPERTKTKTGFMAGSIYSNVIPWHEYAAKFVDATRQGIGSLKNFIQGWEARAWKATAADMQPSEIEAHCGSYRIGQLVVNPIAIMAGVDVQKDHFWYVVRAYSYLAESWLVKYGRLDSFEALIELLRLDYHGPGGEVHKVNLCCIDSGDGNRQEEIYDFCIKMYPLCQPIKGAHQFSLSSVIRPSRIPNRGDMQLWNIDKGHAMGSLFEQRLRIKYADPGHWWLPRREDIGDDYMRSATSWKFMEEKGKGYFGANRKRWVSTSDTFEHLFDCESYLEAAACYYGLPTAQRPDNEPRQTYKPTEQQQAKSAWWTRRNGGDYWG